MRPPTHLTHLQRDNVGRPVPYINVIGAHDIPRSWHIAYDRNIGQIGAYYKDDPDGEPNFFRQSIQRQRECAYRGLCQVCARPVPWSDRALVISTVSVDLHGRRVAVITEPWLCPDCADFATRACPALIRRRHDDDLTILPVTSPDDCQLVLSRGWIDGPYEAATRASNVAMWCKVLLPSEVLGVAPSPGTLGRSG